MPTVLILLHETDRYPDRQGYAIWTLVERWREAGIRVEVAKGIDRVPGADLVFPHIDRTVIPPEYREFLERQPRVINRGIYDVSKRRISTLLVGPGDAYDGPVIVKTDLNHGGLRESASNPGGFIQRFRRKARSLTGIDWGTVRTMLPRDYPVFPSLADVPRAAFENPALVVERFLPQREGGLYCLQMYSFLGDRRLTTCLKSRLPVVKSHAARSNEAVADPPGMEELRRRMGLDYGKLDHVLHEGRPVVVDLNLTPAVADHAHITALLAERLAPGIYGFLKG